MNEKSYPKKNIFDISSLVAQGKISERLRGVREQLAHSVVSPSDLRIARRKLEGLQREISPSSKEEFASIYGRLDKLMRNNQIDALFEKAVSLRRNSHSAKELIEEIKSTQEKISQIQKENALDRLNRRFLYSTLQILRHLLSANELPLNESKRVLLATSPETYESTERAALACSLYEIAYFFYRGQEDAAYNLFNQLPPNQKIRFQEHSLMTGAHFSKEGPIRDLPSYRKNLLLLAQTCIAMAKEVAYPEEIQHYPSFEEISAIFSDLEEIQKENASPRTI